MIDMEFAFALNKPELSDFNELLALFITKQKETRQRQLRAICSGFCDGWTLLNSRAQEIANLLKAETFAKDYPLPLHQEASSIVIPHLQCYGL